MCYDSGGKCMVKFRITSIFHAHHNMDAAKLEIYRLIPIANHGKKLLYIKVAQH